MNGSRWLGALLAGTAAWGAFAAELAPVCDIDVLYIERTPRYARYAPQYGLKGLENQPTLVRPGPDGEPAPADLDAVDREQRWPKEGQMVMFTAVVENKGNADAPPFEYQWRLDGAVVVAGKTEKALRPGERVEMTFGWKWKFERHEVMFWADPMRRVRQWSFANDQRTHWTHAKLLICYADRTTYESFAKSRNFLGTYSFEDWCQAHVDWMNHLFAESVYPETAPDGILDRVAVGFIGVLDDEEARREAWRPIESGEAGWDGAWWFGRNADCARWAANMDWGLIHEWGHQLGLTDLYALDVAAEANLIDDGGGDPLLIGAMSHYTDTMMHGHGPVCFSEDQAIAMNHQLWRRRGYYGDYYYNLARKNYVRVQDSAGEPVRDAVLRIWQRPMTTGVFAGEPTFTGKTGADGRFLLPNQSAPHVVTHGDFGGGYELRDNPFGLIHVVGPNGVLFVEVQARGQTDYAFLEIPQFNIACARQGDVEATVTIPTTLPVARAAPAPNAPAAEADAGDVTLTLPGVRKWVVMRADPPHYAWRRVGETESGAYAERLPGSGLFRYAACTERDGVLSARSPAVGVASLQEPWGLAVDARGAAYVRDRANGKTLLIKPDGGAVGFIGSVHWHFEGSYDLAAGPDSMLYVAKWPDGYDPKNAWIRRFDPHGFCREHDRRDVAGGACDDAAPGRFKQPMGVWVSPEDGRIVVADTGNDRVQILSADGKVEAVVTGLKQPHKALLVGDRLVVADTGAQRVAVFARDGDDWREVASIDGFDKPIYLCRSHTDDVWAADQGAGRVYAIDTHNWRRRDEWCFPAQDESPIADLRGIAYSSQTGELLYVDGGAKAVKRRVVLD